ncbi:MAG: sulfate adenylyltransferase [Chloroflexi bacterium RBG_13_48_17]|nr:MAG: sulfate adenylyltransferase [Chloroflexi bacterium RBG_13_48_17]
MADKLIKPHGSDTLNPLYVADNAKRAELLKEAQTLPSIVVCSQAAANAVMLGAGYFNPLKGYMGLKESLSVAEKMQTNDGLFWPVPIVNVVKDASSVKGAKRIALKDPNVAGNPVIAVQDVQAIEEATEEQMKLMAEKVFGTLDEKHPGVANWVSAGRTFISGPIQVLNYSYFATDFPETFRTAPQIREMIQKHGWNKVVAFQTRNPMHRAHEELVKMAMQETGAEGAVIHMLLGKLKKGDIPADVRDMSIRKMVEHYFKPNTVEVTGYGFDMLYAGPREALLHAIFRQNMGATTLITGRDHAGVGSYYGPFDAQTIFDKIPKDALKIGIYRGDNTVWCHKCKAIVMVRNCSHTNEDHLNLSGTKVREMLSKGESLPPEFSRPEVAKILMGYYQSDRAKE